MHKPVLLHESIKALDLKDGEVFLDATFGGGGHSREVRQKFGNKVRILGIDRDPQVAKENPTFEVKTENFANLDKVIEKIKPDAIFFDLGLSSNQLESAGRGFSFLRDEPLDMRMSGEGITASEILNSWDEYALELILRGFGEEKSSRKIARKIVKRRKVKPFTTTFDLVEIAGKRKGKIHPATKTFQALRIATNEELTAIETGLEKGFEALNGGGRMAVISFHSLEDRIVKNFFREKIKEGVARQVTRKPITPSSDEIRDKNRSRSAKLRIISKYDK